MLILKGLKRAPKPSVRFFSQKKPWDINIDSQVDTGQKQSATYQHVSRFFKNLFSKEEETKETKGLNDLRDKYKANVEKSN
jgi:hypothetical protein